MFKKQPEVFRAVLIKKLSTMWEKMDKSGIKWENLYYLYIAVTEAFL